MLPNTPEYSLFVPLSAAAESKKQTGTARFLYATGDRRTTAKTPPKQGNRAPAGRDRLPGVRARGQGGAARTEGTAVYARRQSRGGAAD